ncbi:cyclohexanone monooxygenase [Trichoderma arundinaceum]|uniref:Cyclohexanone monooxygenase n=1 Tax=Trichoderma arundinaceum TaxID=490622 RepID=A0A395NBT6_TRIAR|nr:cyclohexanone monooxygenase [Trichoderma arundinaceum]
MPRCDITRKPSLIDNLKKDWVSTKATIQTDHEEFITTSETSAELSFMQLLIAALRYFPLLSAEATLQDFDGEWEAPAVNDDYCKFLCQTALRLGFDNEKVQKNASVISTPKKESSTRQEVTQGAEGTKAQNVRKVLQKARKAQTAQMAQTAQTVQTVQTAREPQDQQNEFDEAALPTANNRRMRPLELDDEAEDIAINPKNKSSQLPPPKRVKRTRAPIQEVTEPIQITTMNVDENETAPEAEFTEITSREGSPEFPIMRTARIEPLEDDEGEIT